MTSKAKRYRAMMLLIALSLSLVFTSAAYAAPDNSCTITSTGIEGYENGIYYEKTNYCESNTYYEWNCGGLCKLYDKGSTECDGRCTNRGCEDCEDDCLYSGQRICDANDGGYRICGYYDNDACLDWKQYECDPDETCSGGYCERSCTDRCDYSGQSVCTGDGEYRVCERQGDGCLNWEYEECDPDQYCSGGTCHSGCTDDCDDYGERECTQDDEYRVCGYYDSDVCLDWKYYDCDSGEECSRGYCTEECEEGYEREYRCEGNWLQRLYIDDDCSEDWRDYEYCRNGCSNDECRDDCNDYCSPCDHSCTPCNPCQGNNCNICPYQNYCGDGWCNGGENCLSCPTDCGSCQPQNYCGNGICSNGESCSTCPTDCGACNYCGDGSCNNGESCSTCPTDCGACNYCGDGSCNNGESCSTCPTDCGACNYCGNGICGAGESCSNCPQDCGSCNYCGDGSCSSGEECSNCPQDCGSCAPVEYCGDGSCNNGELCSTCPTDCGPCEYCGDGICGDSESCTNCLTDCGQCLIPDVVDPSELCTETDECVIVINDTNTGSDNDNGGPSGAFVVGDMSWLPAVIWLLVILNIILFVVVVIRRLKK